MILDDLYENARERVALSKTKKSLSDIKKEALALPRGDFRFIQSLSKDGLSFICEVKKASPSKGIISEDFPYMEIAREYEEAGADAISVLTEPKYFLGSDEIFRQIREKVSLPMIRKDFTVDEYQIYEAKLLGADAILLIVAILSQEDIRRYLQICDELGICALVEAHDKEEIEVAIQAGARIIGVNNRNLKDFSVDVENALNLKRYIADDIIFVAESGIQSVEDITTIAKSKTDAVLIGETLMRATNKKALLNQFKKAASDE